MILGKKAPLPILLGFLITLLLGVTPAFALEIRILERVQVTGSKLTLGEAARFSDDTDPRVPALKEIVIAHAPAAGKRLVLDGAFLNYRLGTRLGQPDLNLVVPGKLEVERLAQEIHREELERIFRQDVRKHLPASSEQVNFRNIRAPQVIHLPKGKVTYRVRKLGRSAYYGTVSLLVKFSVDGVRQRAVRVSGQVEVMEKLVIAGRNLKRHQVIAPEAVALKLMNIARVPASGFTQVSEVIGMQTRQAIRAGQVILPRMLKTVPVVKRGDHLVVVAESANLRVTTTAKALEDGNKGEQVRVANISSGKEIRARVVGPRRVVVEF